MSVGLTDCACMCAREDGRLGSVGCKSIAVFYRFSFTSFFFSFSSQKPNSYSSYNLICSPFWLQALLLQLHFHSQSQCSLISHACFSDSVFSIHFYYFFKLPARDSVGCSCITTTPTAVQPMSNLHVHANKSPYTHSLMQTDRQYRL